MQESGEGLDPTAFNEREGAIGIAQWRLGEEKISKRSPHRGEPQKQISMYSLSS